MMAVDQELRKRFNTEEIKILGDMERRGLDMYEFDVMRHPKKEGVLYLRMREDMQDKRAIPQWRRATDSQKDWRSAPDFELFSNGDWAWGDSGHWYDMGRFRYTLSGLSAEYCRDIQWSPSFSWHLVRDIDGHEIDLTEKYNKRGSITGYKVNSHGNGDWEIQECTGDRYFRKIDPYRFAGFDYHGEPMIIDCRAECAAKSIVRSTRDLIGCIVGTKTAKSR